MISKNKVKEIQAQMKATAMLINHWRVSDIASEIGKCPICQAEVITIEKLQGKYSVCMTADCEWIYKHHD